MKFTNKLEALEYGSPLAAKLFDLQELGGYNPQIIISKKPDLDIVAIKLNREWKDELITSIRKKIHDFIHNENIPLIPYNMELSKITDELLENAIRMVTPPQVSEHGGSITLSKFDPIARKVILDFGGKCGEDLDNVDPLICNKAQRLGTFLYVSSGLKGLFPNAGLQVVPPEDVAKLLNPTRSPG